MTDITDIMALRTQIKTINSESTREVLNELVAFIIELNTRVEQLETFEEGEDSE